MAGRRWARILVLVAGLVLVATGCKASAGQACGIGQACADGLSCSMATGTCETGSPLSPYCEPQQAGCPANLDAYGCVGGAEPGEPYETGCSLFVDADSGMSGTSTYCCTPVPHCDTFFACGSVGVEIGCNDPMLPQAQDPSVECARLDSIQGWSLYCCAPQAECFQADLFDCGDAGMSYACTGDAAPGESGLTCTAGGQQDAGAAGTYCCRAGAGADGG